MPNAWSFFDSKCAGRETAAGAACRLPAHLERDLPRAAVAARDQSLAVANSLPEKALKGLELRSF